MAKRGRYLLTRSSMALDRIWQNTCAIRMSVALVAAGMLIRPASLTIKSGPHKGKMVQAGQRKLSEFLAHEIGKPEKFVSGAEARKGIGPKRGIISFFQIAGTRQGHIDLVSLEDWPRFQCSGHCYWDAKDVWFWPSH